MQKSTSVTFLRLVGSLFGLLAIAAVICLLGLLYIVAGGLPQPKTALSLTGNTAAVTFCLCGITAWLFHKAHTVEAELTPAELALQAGKRSRREGALYGILSFGLSGAFFLYGTLHAIYQYATDAIFAKSVASGSFWLQVLLEGTFGVLQLVAVGGLIRSTGAPAVRDSSTVA